MKRFLYASTIAGLLACGCSNVTLPFQNNSISHGKAPGFTVPDETQDHRPSEPQLVYHNTEYNFTFSLPPDWQGYSVLTQQWSGQTYSPATDKTVETAHGPIIVLRHPQWKADDPCQDIPILVFTRTQWKADHEGQFSIYGAGYEYEISHNSKYVIAVWNHFSEGKSIKGAKEAEGIVTRNQLAHTPHLYPQ